MSKNTQIISRKRRVRTKLRAISNRPRLSVHRSNQNIWAQLIDDDKGVTLASSSNKTLKLKGTKTEQAVLVGEDIATKALKKKITKVVFDRGAYKYHGRIKALAEAARKKGLEF